MTRFTPLQFKDAFLKSVTPFDSQIVSLWDKRRDYTALMLDFIFPEIAKALKISVYNADYYYLDSVFYAERDSDHFGDSAIHAKCLSIAVEHEHVLAGTEVEMNKLQLFNASLKVLITYPQTDELRGMYLDRYTKIVREADIFSDFATLRRALVVFGQLSGHEITWSFYAYEASGFQAV